MKASIRPCLGAALLLAACPAILRAQPLSFEDVVRNLRNPDHKVRMSAVQVLREAKYPEAIVPMAPLVNDPVNEIQLEALAAELSFFLVEDVQARRKVAFIVEVRDDSPAARAFEMGPLAAWPREAPAELIGALLQAVDDESKKVRLEAIYTLGVIGGDRVNGDHAGLLIKALDHYDPAIRMAAAEVIGRLRTPGAGPALIKAMNDSSEQVRNASMRALGRLREESAIKALTDQFNYRPKGESAWSALDALARIAHASSIPLFRERLADRDPWLRRAAAEGLGRAGDKASLDAVQAGAGGDESEMVRAAMAFALVRLGGAHAVRLVDFLDSPRMGAQVEGYLLDMGPSVIPELLPRLQEPDETTRRSIIGVIGALGDASSVAVLEPLLQDRNRDVVKAATFAIERIKMRTE